jgi:hypothetical protein
MNFARFSVLFSAFNFSLVYGDISIKNINTYTWGDGNPIVLWHSTINLVNFMKRLTSINVLCLAYMKQEHCSKQYTVRHVFMSIN